MSHEGVVTPPAKTPSSARMAGALIVYNPGHPAEPRRSIGTVRSSSKHRSAAFLERPGWATKQTFVTKTGQPNSLSTASIRLAGCRFQIENAVKPTRWGVLRNGSNLRAFGPDRVERLVQRGEESPFADQFGDAVPSHIREKIGIDAPEDNANTLARKLFKQPADGLRRGKAYVVDRFRVADGRAPYSPQLPGERPTTSRMPCSTPAATT
jgi:hypothetical protein